MRKLVLRGFYQPDISKIKNPITGDNDYYATCGKCGELVGTSPDGTFDCIDDVDNFCRRCGSEVDWRTK